MENYELIRQLLNGNHLNNEELERAKQALHLATVELSIRIKGKKLEKEDEEKELTEEEKELTDEEKELQNIIEQIENLSDDDLMQLNNIFCEKNNYCDDEIYNNDEDFLETFFEGRILEFARASSYGDYNYNHDFVKFDGYGNLETMDCLISDDLADSIEVVAQFALDNQHLFEDILEFDNE